VGVGRDYPLHERGERGPRVPVVGQRLLGLGDVAVQAVPAQLPQHVLLAGIAAVEGGDADAGPLGHLGDRGGRVGDEHRARGVQDQLVVAGRLGLPARKRRGGTRRGITRHGPILADQNVLFC
jgi:hypothetical protein